ncbi:MAG: flagellar basal body P-ring formation chaperone FlgA [Steroidobacteraceae bacterium]
MRRTHCFWFLYLLSAAIMPVQATGFESLQAIQTSAEQHLRTVLPNNSGNVYFKTDELDNRLRLADCPTPLEAFLPSGASIGSRVTIGVRCTQGTQWTVYVPVSIESEAPSLILNKALARNAAVTAQDVEIRVQRLPGLGSTNLRSVAELDGKRLKRDLPAGTILNPAMLQPEILIHRGQQVTVVAKMAGIEVRSQAVALGDGSINSRIRVKNLNSAKVVEGLVDNSNMVRVDL